MNKNYKMWIRLILVMSSVMATFLGLQMFILIDLEKYQAVVTAEATNEVAMIKVEDVVGDMPPLNIVTIAADPPTLEPLPTIVITETPLVPTETPVAPTAVATTVAASAPIVTIRQNQVALPTAQAILPPVAVIQESQTVTVQNTVAQNTTGSYTDGSYLGDSIRTDRWGYTQVRAIIENGQLVDIEIVQYPNHTDRSAQISLGALPTLVSEAIQNQSATVDIVTRATDTSWAFMSSLRSALEDA